MRTEAEEHDAVGGAADRRPISTLLLPLVVSVATAATLVVNYLANGLPINGQTTGDVTRRSACPS